MLDLTYLMRGQPSCLQEYSKGLSNSLTSFNYFPPPVTTARLICNSVIADSTLPRKCFTAGVSQAGPCAYIEASQAPSRRDLIHLPLLAYFPVEVEHGGDTLSCQIQDERKL